MVRDATRILMAQRLVEVKHGLGVFVTPPQNEAFGEALLLALRRAGVTVWDVEQFEQVVLPEVVALAATTATAEEIADYSYQEVVLLRVLTRTSRNQTGRYYPRRTRRHTKFFIFLCVASCSFVD